MSEYKLESSSSARSVPKRVALVRRDVSARLLDDRSEVTTTAPHLLLREIVLIQLCIVALSIVSLAFDAPLEGIADPDHTPNPAKAPWYFLGLQELLHYFPPVVAGVLIPTLVVIGLVVIPYFRVNVDVVGLFESPAPRTFFLLTVVSALLMVLLVLFHVWPVLVPTVVIYLLMAVPAMPFVPNRIRKRFSGIPLADWIMTWFVAVSVILTIIGVYFRGPGWGWVWPWIEGIF